MATLDLLPVDAWSASVAGCLTGWELLEFARVSRWAWSCFSQDRFWRDRVPRGVAEAAVNATAVTPHPALSAYTRAFSLRFQGLAVDPQEKKVIGRGACAQLESFRNLFVVQRRSFSFGMWFSLLKGVEPEDDATTGMFAGGILIGGQSSSFDDQYWAYYHQQFVIVSSDRTLYCSVLDAKPEIATNLECNRWYHLALTYDEIERVQQVYLDGRIVNTLNGSLHSEWWNMSYAQIGTGCVTAGGNNFPTPDSCGWYGFHGLIDDFRMWTKVLSVEEVVDLARNDNSTLEGAQTDGSLWYSLKRDMVFFPPQHAVRVSCSRPQERAACIHGNDVAAVSSTNEAPVSAAARTDRANWQQNRRMNPARRGRPQRPGPPRPDYAT
ncbi:Atp-binding protein, partial [Globisporangium splendens]